MDYKFSSMGILTERFGLRLSGGPAVLAALIRLREERETTGITKSLGEEENTKYGPIPDVGKPLNSVRPDFAAWQTDSASATNHRTVSHPLPRHLRQRSCCKRRSTIDHYFKALQGEKRTHHSRIRTSRRARRASKASELGRPLPRASTSLSNRLNSRLNGTTSRAS